MPTKKPSSSKSKAQVQNQSESLPIISWLRWTEKINRKYLAIGLVLLVVATYGGYVLMRAANSGYCNDWVFKQDKYISIGSLKLEKPSGWQQHYCFSEKENEYQGTFVLDYQIPDLARISWIMGIGDGWGMFAPTNSGLIEISAGKVSADNRLSDVEKKYTEQSTPPWIKRTVQKIQIDGKQALQVVTEQDPNLNDGQSGRYSYYNDILIENDGKMYNVRLWNNWHKSESRDAWIAKYEPIFDQMVKSAAFK